MDKALYEEIILDHYKHPHHKGLREPYDVEVHKVNPTCGDSVAMRVALDDDRITDISYDNVGCSISQASTSVMADLLIGRTTDEAAALRADFEEMVRSRGKIDIDSWPKADSLEDGIAFFLVHSNTQRQECALLGWKAYADAVHEIHERKPA